MWQMAIAEGGKAAFSSVGVIMQDSRARSSDHVQSGIMSNNAEMSELAAAQSIQSGILNIQQLKRDLSQVQGKARTAAGASGVVVGEGSSLDVLMSNAGEAARQESMIRWEAEYAAWQHTWEAYNARYEAALAEAQAPNSFDTILGVASAIGGAAAAAYQGGAFSGSSSQTPYAGGGTTGGDYFTQRAPGQFKH